MALVFIQYSMESLQNHRWNSYPTKFTPRVYSVGQFFFQTFVGSEFKILFLQCRKIVPPERFSIEKRNFFPNGRPLSCHRSGSIWMPFFHKQSNTAGSIVNIHSLKHSSVAFVKVVIFWWNTCIFHEWHNVLTVLQTMEPAKGESCNWEHEGGFATPLYIHNAQV